MLIGLVFGRTCNTTSSRLTTQTKTPKLARSASGLANTRIKSPTYQHSNKFVLACDVYLWETLFGALMSSKKPFATLLTNEKMLCVPVRHFPGQCWHTKTRCARFMPLAHQIAHCDKVNSVSTEHWEQDCVLGMDNLINYKTNTCCNREYVWTLWDMWPTRCHLCHPCLHTRISHLILAIDNRRNSNKNQ